MLKKIQQLLIFPFNGNAREALMVAIAQNQIKKRWNIIGFIDDDLTKKGQTACGFTVLGGRNIFERYRDAKVIAVPGRDSNFFLRQKIIDSLKLPPQRWAVLIDPTVTVANDARIGYNTVLMPGCVVNATANIGNHCVVLPNTVISHDSHIGDYTLIGSNASISGGVTIGEGCYIGTGSSIIQEIRIGNGSLVGMGSAVIKSVPSKTIVAGCPAEIIRRPCRYTKAKKERKNAGY